MDIAVTSLPGNPRMGTLRWGGVVYRCALGRGGITTAKAEGDGATPAGRFPLRELRFRADRLEAPTTGLVARALEPDDGWCDDPNDTNYNRPVTHPYPARAERLWRVDGRYDLVIVVGYNDAPVVPGVGSAIFIHVATADYGPTEGCIALSREDLLTVLAGWSPDTPIWIEP